MAVMIIQLFQFIFYIARADQMQQKIDLLFENKIACVANLMGFNDGQREILKTAAWMALNNMMLSQPKEYSEDRIHLAQWILVIQIGKNVQHLLNINNNYSTNHIWNDSEIVANGQENGYSTMQLIQFMVERCR